MRRCADQSYALMTIGSTQKRSRAFHGNLTMDQRHAHASACSPTHAFRRTKAFLPSVAFISHG
jgi:hypothetical protein